MQFIKLIILVIIVVSTDNQSIAQKLKYKDVFKTVQNESKELSYAMLKEYQKTDTLHANSFYQLAKISDYWARNFNPLIQTTDVEYFISDALKYYKKALKILDEKQFKRDDDYFIDVPFAKDKKKVALTDVTEHINKQIAEIGVYRQNIDNITGNFNSAVNHYNKCWSVYIEINKAYKEYNDLCLMADNNLINKLNTLISSYDSTNFYFDQYKNALKKNPIKSYDQKLAVQSIETYRLDGITQSNFINPHIEIWDYKFWATNLKNIINTDIKSFRDKINEIHLKFNTLFSQLEGMNEVSSFVPYTIENELILKIGKYDQTSLIIGMFKYREAKLLFARDGKEIEKLQDSSVFMKLQRKIKKYHDLPSRFKQLDSLNAAVKSLATPENVKKYGAFFQQYYSGVDGFKQYLNYDKTKNNDLLTAAFNSIKSTLLETTWSDKSKTVEYNKNQIPFYQSLPDSLSKDPDKYYTLNITENKKGENYLCGYYCSPQKQISAFVAKVIKGNTIKWLKFVNVPKSDYCCGIKVKSFENGCFAIVNFSIAGKRSNSVHKFEDNGNEISAIKLENNNIPRYFDFDEINEQFIIAFKDTVIKSSTSNYSNLQIGFYGIDGKSIFIKDIKLQGNLVDVVKTGDNYLIVSNFSHYFSDIGHEYHAGPNENNKLNMFCMLIDKTGQVVKTENLITADPFWGIKAEKINSNIINILGFKGPYLQNFDQSAVNQPLLYILIDSKANLVNSNVTTLQKKN